MLNEGDVLPSALSSVTCCLLLFYQGWTVPGFIFLLYTFYFFSKLFPNKKLNTPDEFNVLIIGSGFSGLCLAKKLNDLGVKYTILEKAKRLGGTWYENTYPGVACDVPSHLYSFSFFPNPNWTHNFSKGDEIRRYLEAAASRFQIYPNIEFGKKVVSTKWNSSTSTWTVSTEEGKEYIANILVQGHGILHAKNVPKFKGLDRFKGKAVHTAEWDNKFDVRNKKIGVIGTGASAVQAVPCLAQAGVDSLKVFQRTPCWSFPRNDFQYPTFIKKLFSLLPALQTLYRWSIFLALEMRFALIFNEKSWLYRIFYQKIEKGAKDYYYKTIKDPDTARRLIPVYGMGCKRITPSDTYLQSFNEKCVSLVTTGIECITENGIMTVDGEEHKLDVIVLATGYDLIKSYHGFSNYTKDGKLLSEIQGDTPRNYLGITQPDTPNCFWMLGPGTGLGHNSIIYMLECQADYISDAITKMVQNKVRCMVVKKKVEMEYWKWIMQNMKGKVFSDNSSCIAWYRNERGVNWVLWPLDLFTYWWMTRTCNLSDYNTTM